MPDMLFYLDPPYWGCEDDCGKEMFSARECEQLADQFGKTKGRFMMSITDLPSLKRSGNRSAENISVIH